MRTTHVCPKCGNNQLLHVRQVADRLGEAYAHHLGAEPTRGPTSDEPSDQWRLARANKQPHPGKVKMVSVGRVQAYVCRACGFTELYTADVADIPIDGHFVVAVTGPAKGSPFR
jgi:predicted nucleic-acid-binding Zn-ribbon protein